MRKGRDKIKSIEELINICNNLKINKINIVSINGSFDRFNYIHATFLEKAKEMGDILIVGINTNDSKKEYFINQQDRTYIVSAMESVDYVTISSEQDYLKFVDSIKPPMHFNGFEDDKNYIDTILFGQNGEKINVTEVITNSPINLIKRINELYKSQFQA